jgi:type IV pilus assembly protein PilW
MMDLSNMKKQLGLSMIELMVAMTISAILLLGVSMIFISNKKTYQTQDALSEVQEAGRFALQFLSEPIQMAGYTGCGNMELIPTIDVRKQLDQSIDVSATLRGFEDVGAKNDNTKTTLRDVLEDSYPQATYNVDWDNVATNWVSGTDIISIYFMQADGTTVTGNTTPVNSNIKINGNPTALAQNDSVMITDCQVAYVINITNSPATSPLGAGVVTLTHGGSNNASNGYCKNNDCTVTPNTGAQVARFVESVYYIGDNNGDNRNTTSLYRINISRTISSGSLVVDELVEGIADMQLVYGVDIDDDRIVDEYQPASTIIQNITTDYDGLDGVDPKDGWRQVLSVQIGLLAESNDVAAREEYAVTFNLPYSVDGNGVPRGQVTYNAPGNNIQFDTDESGSANNTIALSADRKFRMRHAFNSTIAMRNRLP